MVARDSITATNANGGQWGGPFPTGLLAGMGDGTVRMFPYTIPIGSAISATGVEATANTFQCFLTPCGGEACTLPD